MNEKSTILKVLRARKRMLTYYFNSARTTLTRQYWIARLDEVDRIRLEIRRNK